MLDPLCCVQKACGLCTELWAWQMDTRNTRHIWDDVSMSQSRGAPRPRIFFLANLILDMFGFVFWYLFLFDPIWRHAYVYEPSKIRVCQGCCSTALHCSVVQESLCCCSSATSLDDLTLLSRRGWLRLGWVSYWSCHAQPCVHGIGTVEQELLWSATIFVRW